MKSKIYILFLILWGCSFKFDTNQHPIQDIYVREVIKEGKILTNKIISTGLKNRSNAYVKDCPLK